jgi:hypothetical protein
MHKLLQEFEEMTQGYFQFIKNHRASKLSDSDKITLLRFHAYYDSGVTSESDPKFIAQWEEVKKNQGPNYRPICEVSSCISSTQMRLINSKQSN